MYETLFVVPIANESIDGIYSIVERVEVSAYVDVPHGGISAIMSLINVVFPFVIPERGIRQNLVVVTK